MIATEPESFDLGSQSVHPVLGAWDKVGVYVDALSDPLIPQCGQKLIPVASQLSVRPHRLSLDRQNAGGKPLPIDAQNNPLFMTFHLTKETCTYIHT